MFSYPNIADIVALDVQDRPVLYAEVKSDPRSRGAGHDQLQEILSRSNLGTVKFALLVDSQNIEIFGWDGTSLSLLHTFPTQKVFDFYDPGIDPTQIFQAYMHRLVEGWLRDVAYHWKSDEPPYLNELKEIELAPLLADGTTISGGL